MSGDEIARKGLSDIFRHDKGKEHKGYKDYHKDRNKDRNKDHKKHTRKQPTPAVKERPPSGRSVTFSEDHVGMVVTESFLAVLDVLDKHNVAVFTADHDWLKAQLSHLVRRSQYYDHQSKELKRITTK